ncbi:MAG: hypothetical protein NVS2B14_16890 [Chamaesiphon sp.]
MICKMQPKLHIKWRLFDPELGLSSEHSSIEFTNGYKLLVDELGKSYQVSWDLWDE